MAKVTLPILGVEASGTLADSVTFGRWRGVNYARSRVVPANPKTAQQQAQRNLMTWVVHYWQSSPAIVQSAFYYGARGQKMTAFNLFTKKNMVVLKPATHNDLAIASPGMSGAPPIVAINAVGGVGTVTVDATPGDVVSGTTINYVHFVLMARQDVRGPFIPPVRHQSDSASPFSVTFSSLTPGDYVAIAFVEAVDAKGNKLFGLQLNDTATVT